MVLRRWYDRFGDITLRFRGACRWGESEVPRHSRVESLLRRCIADKAEFARKVESKTSELLYQACEAE